MRRYGFTFIKTDGVDYKGSDLIEAAFFLGLFFFPVMIIFNNYNALSIILGYFGICLIYAILAIFAEILTRTAFVTSIIISTGFTGVFVNNGLRALLIREPDMLNFVLSAMMTVYFTLLALVGLNLLKNTKKPKL